MFLRKRCSNVRFSKSTFYRRDLRRAQNKTEEEEISSSPSSSPLPPFLDKVTVVVALLCHLWREGGREGERTCLCPTAIISAKCHSFPGPIIQNIARQILSVHKPQKQQTVLLVRFVHTPPTLPAYNYTVSRKRC